jgi:hypothetical protein
MGDLRSAEKPLAKPPRKVEEMRRFILTAGLIEKCGGSHVKHFVSVYMYVR